MRNVLLIVGALVVCLFLLPFGCGLSIFGAYAADGAATVFAETKPSAMLKKYERFRTMSNDLDAKRANIDAMRSTVESYGDPMGLDRLARNTVMQKQAELAGLKLNFNNLAAQYNAAMDMDHVSFCNVNGIRDICNRAGIPFVAQEHRPLPRQHEAYITN